MSVIINRTNAQGFGPQFFGMNMYMLKNLQTYYFTGNIPIYSFKNSKEQLQDCEIFTSKFPYNPAAMEQLKNWSSYSILNNTVGSCLKETTFQETTG